MKLKSRSSGISLISLIITIIVIIILAAIVIFSGMGTPVKAQFSKVISDIDNVQTAVDQAYYGLYTEKAVAGEVWTKSQFYEAVATGNTNRDSLNKTGLVEIAENSLVKINLPKYEGRKWYIAVSDVSDTVKTGSAVLSPGFESDGKIYATLLDVQNGGGDGSGLNGSSETFVAVEPKNVNDWVYEELADGTLRITKYTGGETEVVIPNSIKGKRVTEVGNGTDFIWGENIVEIVYTEGDMEFGYRLENGQLTISKIVLSEGINTINQGALCGARNLEEVVLPTTLKNMGRQAFNECIKLEKINIPNGVTSIGYEAFNYCESLTSVTIPDSVTSIESCAFDSCSSLPSVIIPDSVTSIGYRAFNWCESLTSVTIPDSVTSIGRGAFRGCSSLTSVIIPDSVTSIGWETFWGCERLSSVIIPSSVTSIEWSAFSCCDSLSSVTIPSSVTSIGGGAFAKISSSATITCDFASKPAGWYNDWTDLPAENINWVGE